MAVLRQRTRQGIAHGQRDAARGIGATVTSREALRLTAHVPVAGAAGLVVPALHRRIVLASAQTRRVVVAMRDQLTPTTHGCGLSSATAQVGQPSGGSTTSGTVRSSTAGPPASKYFAPSSVRR